LGNDTLGEAGGIVARTTIAATVGGTASEIGGGTFANGAVSGAFVHLFNAEGRRYLSNLNARQHAEAIDFRDEVVHMGLDEFNSRFHLNIDQSELRLYRTVFSNSFNVWTVNVAANTLVSGVDALFSSPRSIYDGIVMVHDITGAVMVHDITGASIGTSGNLGYEFGEGSVELRRIYEIK